MASQVVQTLGYIMTSETRHTMNSKLLQLASTREISKEILPVTFSPMLEFPKNFCNADYDPLESLGPVQDFVYLSISLYYEDDNFHNPAQKITYLSKLDLDSIKLLNKSSAQIFNITTLKKININSKDRLFSRHFVYRKYYKCTFS